MDTRIEQRWRPNIERIPNLNIEGEEKIEDIPYLLTIWVSPMSYLINTYSLTYLLTSFITRLYTFPWPCLKCDIGRPLYKFVWLRVLGVFSKSELTRLCRVRQKKINETQEDLYRFKSWESEGSRFQLRGMFTQTLPRPLGRNLPPHQLSKKVLSSSRIY